MLRESVRESAERCVDRVVIVIVDGGRERTSWHGAGCCEGCCCCWPWSGCLRVVIVWLEECDGRAPRVAGVLVS